MDETPDSILEDLYQVGKTKCVGYLPTDTIINLCKKKVKDLILFAQINGLEYIVFEKGEGSVANGCVVFYHEEMLLEMLNRYKQIFIDAEIPISNTFEYIDYIHKKTVYKEKYPYAYIAIGKTFNDCRFRDYQYNTK